MAKFKKGDMVKCIRLSNEQLVFLNNNNKGLNVSNQHGGWKENKVFKIHSIYLSGMLPRYYEFNSNGIYEPFLELVKKKEPFKKEDLIL